jgi:branched-chain amino acid aminotransferase
VTFHSVDSGIKKTARIWVNGTFMDWDDCKVHVMSHVLHYGSSVFEGIRCYETASGPAIFRLREHVRRLLDSAKPYRMTVPYTQEQLEDAILETAQATGLRSCYVRPIIFRGYGSLGVNPLTSPVDVVIAAFEWGKYLGKDAVEKGVDVRVSSWTRIAPNTMATVSKCSANYACSALIKMEALADGYAEGIALDVNGNLSEGSGENVFLVRDGQLRTPSLACSILPGITRDSVMQLARRRGIEVVETEIPRSDVYRADELFFTGTAAEITPIRSVDRVVVGDGARGPVTRQMQEDFFAVVTGRGDDAFGWLTPLQARQQATGRR